MKKKWSALFFPLLLSACTNGETKEYLAAETIVVQNAQVSDSVPPGEQYIAGCYLEIWYAGFIGQARHDVSGTSVSYLDAKYGAELPQSYKALPAPAPTSIDIVCNRDLDDYPAGTSLMELFEVHASPGSLPYVNWKENTALSAEVERRRCLWIYPDYYMLVAHPDPGLGLDCTYTVTVTLADGRRLQASIRRDNANQPG